LPFENLSLITFHTALHKERKTTYKKALKGRENKKAHNTTNSK